jgi:cell division protein FtsB
MLRCIGVALTIFAAVVAASAQDAGGVEGRAEGLRAQLRTVVEEEARLRERVRLLEEELEPQNVERSVAAVGTTDARALREQRREQLERQKAGVEQQLASLAASRSRLESAISTAEAEAVRLRAVALGAANAPPRPAPAAQPTPPPAVKKGKAPARKSRPRKRSRPRRRP